MFFYFLEKENGVCYHKNNKNIVKNIEEGEEKKRRMRIDIIEKLVNELVPYENNPRHNDEAVEYVANSINEFGFRVPIVIDCNNIIVCGHTRYKAAQRLNLEKVPCIQADDLTEEQIKAFRLADNKTQELAEWDWNIIFEELDAIYDIDMNRMGFKDFLDDEKGVLKERKLKDSEEIDLDSFGDEEFNQVCPCCGFRFNE